MQASDFEGIDTTPSIYAAKNTPFGLLHELKIKYPQISLRHLGKLVGISAEAVRQHFLRHGIDFESGKPVAIEIFKQHRADILASKQIETLNALTPAKLKGADPKSLAILFGTLYDKERLERGLSTSNQAVIYASAIESAFSQKTEKPVVAAEITPVKSDE